MPKTILGLDIGGANLKVATPDRRAISVPFALWKQPDRLPTALAELVAQFPDAGELAVTMTGELCDCFETKREGVNGILTAVDAAANGRPVRVWSTDGAFVDVGEARRDHLKVAAANWHALATFAGRYAQNSDAILVDIGSTTTDIIPISCAKPVPEGLTDSQRLASGELVYIGVRRTPICAVLTNRVCAELFATTQDVYVVLGELPEDPECNDTADGRPLTSSLSLARLARMLGGDDLTLKPDRVIDFAIRVHRRVVERIVWALRNVSFRWDDLGDVGRVIVSGIGEGLARQAVAGVFSGVFENVPVSSLNDDLGPTVSACAPAYAVAVLASEKS